MRREIFSLPFDMTQPGRAGGFNLSRWAIDHGGFTAFLLVLLLRCFGERLSPRWRFLLWGVVLSRLLFVATPVSPWSVFNVVRWNPETSARPGRIALRPPRA